MSKIFCWCRNVPYFFRKLYSGHGYLLGAVIDKVPNLVHLLTFTILPVLSLGIFLIMNFA
jgi:hypothetical protein